MANARTLASSSVKSLRHEWKQWNIVEGDFQVSVQYDRPISG
jgi:hypothetical protein